MEYKFKVGDRIRHKFGTGTITSETEQYYGIEWDKKPSIDENGGNKNSLILKTEAHEYVDNCNCDGNCGDDCTCKDDYEDDEYCDCGPNDLCEKCDIDDDMYLDLDDLDLDDLLDNDEIDDYFNNVVKSKGYKNIEDFMRFFGKYSDVLDVLILDNCNNLGNYYFNKFNNITTLCSKKECYKLDLYNYIFKLNSFFKDRNIGTLSSTLNKRFRKTSNGWKILR